MRMWPFSVVAWALLLIGRPDQVRAAGDEKRVAWLRQNAIPIATLDPASRDLADLEPLRKILGGVRVVMLGEAVRGGGNDLLVKTRLVGFLHREMGFDVLVFEGGFYDCARSWEAIRAGADTRKELDRVLLPYYTEAAQFQPLIDLVAARAASERPLAIAGIDNQMGGGMDAKSLAGDLRATLPRFGIAPESVSGLGDLEAALIDVLAERYGTGEVAVPSRQQRQRVLAVLADLRRRLAAWRAPQPSASPAATTELGATADAAARPDAAFWLQVLDNVESYAEASWRQGKYVPASAFSPELHNLRDRQMAANLVWLARHRYRDRKLIVWSLNVHLARELDLLTSREAATRAKFDEMSTIGDEVAKALGPEVYTIALTAFEGSQGTPRRQPYPLFAPTRGSFEDLMGRTGLEAALVDLRHLPTDGGWLRSSLVARPISYKELLGIWPRHIDALLFLRKQEPARKR